MLWRLVQLICLLKICKVYVYVYVYVCIYIYIRVCVCVCDRAKINKGIGVEVLHYLNDGLWTLKEL